MTTTKNELLAGLKATTAGDTIFVYEDATADEVNKRIEKKMMREGISRHNDDGSKSFYKDRVIFDPSSGYHELGRYTWDKSGNRVKYSRHRVTVKDGQIISDKFVKHIYKAL